MKDEEIVGLFVKTSWALARYITEINTVHIPKSHRKEVIEADMEIWNQVFNAYMGVNKVGESGTDKGV